MAPLSKVSYAFARIRNQQETLGGMLLLGRRVRGQYQGGVERQLIRFRLITAKVYGNQSIPLVCCRTSPQASAHLQQKLP